MLLLDALSEQRFNHRLGLECLAACLVVLAELQPTRRAGTICGMPGDSDAQRDGQVLAVLRANPAIGAAAVSLPGLGISQDEVAKRIASRWAGEWDCLFLLPACLPPAGGLRKHAACLAASSKCICWQHAAVRSHPANSTPHLLLIETQDVCRLCGRLRAAPGYQNARHQHPPAQALPPVPGQPDLLARRRALPMEQDDQGACRALCVCMCSARVRKAVGAVGSTSGADALAAS